MLEDVSMPTTITFAAVAAAEPDDTMDIAEGGRRH